MADQTKGASPKDTATQDSGHTQAGQEAVRGVGAGEHDREHQSNYGGGGEHGGSGKGSAAKRGGDEDATK